MQGIDPGELFSHIIVPAINALGARYASRKAAYLLLATAAQESRLGRYLRQINGPACGIYQMEPATLHDLYANYLAHGRGELAVQLGREEPERLIYDLRYATQVARLHYYRFPEPLPQPWDVEKTWELYKQRWNTPLGAASRFQFVGAWNRYVEPLLNAPVEA